MPMYPCRECKTNSWSYEAESKVIKATCKQCGAIVQWQKKVSAPTPKKIAHRRKMETPKLVVGALFREDPHFIDNGAPPW